MKVIRLSGNWVVAKDFRIVDSGRVSGEKSGKLDDYENYLFQVWTGTGWSSDHGRAKAFASEEEAGQYAEQNKSDLEANL